MNSRPRPQRRGRLTTRRIALAAMFLALCCAACGQRGPLYLPQSEPASTAPPLEDASPDEGYEEREPDDGDSG